MKQKLLMMKAFVLGTAVLSMTSCGIDMPKEVNTSFETMTVKKQDITVPMKFSAKMKGQSDVTITPQVSGQLMKIVVNEGQLVKKGQTLFVIDSRNAQLDLEAAQANLDAALANENSAKLEYESNKNLFDKQIVSRYMLDNSANAYRQAQASVAQARASVNRAKVNLGFCTITAPVTGIIGEIPVRAGDQVSPMTELTMLSGNTTMDAEFSVTESLIEESVSAQPDRCGECNHRFVVVQGFFPQSRRPSVLRHPRHCDTALCRKRSDNNSSGCRSALAGQVARLYGEGRQHSNGCRCEDRGCRQRQGLHHKDRPERRRQDRDHRSQQRNRRPESLILIHNS